MLWGATLSPFALKVEALLRFAGLPHRWLPAQGRFPDAIRFEIRRRRLVSGRLPLTWPRKTELDEFPLVPFVFGPQGENLYDSSAIAAWLDSTGRTLPHLLPEGDPALRFAVQLVDEALDEVGLYLVHHNRWVVSARDNDAGARLAGEMAPLLGPFAPALGRTFPARQVRRLPYLFSIAAPDAGYDDLPRRLRTPERAGFPPTHELLDDAFTQLLSALEPVLGASPFLFGERFTLADASVYGQLEMNRSDPTAARRMRRAAKDVCAWIERLANGDFAGHRVDGALQLDSRHAPLLAWVAHVFVPLMQQNHDAFEAHVDRGERCFNEAGFNAGRGLYEGVLLGRPFRSVVKTFQVRVWRDLRRSFDALDPGSRRRLLELLPADAALDRDGFAAPGAGVA